MLAFKKFYDYYLFYFNDKSKTYKVITLAVILIGILIFIILAKTLNWVKTSLIIENLMTSLGIIVAGWWTYKLFIQQREDKPKLETKINHEFVKVTDSKTLLNFKIYLYNIGNVALKSDWAIIRLFKISPLSDELIEAVNCQPDPISDDQTEYEGDYLNYRIFNLSKINFHIEPGETHTLYAHFFVDSGTQVVRINFFIKNLYLEENKGWKTNELIKINN